MVDTNRGKLFYCQFVGYGQVIAMAHNRNKARSPHEHKIKHFFINSQISTNKVFSKKISILIANYQIFSTFAPAK
jgi:hypothetical protein